MEHHLPQHTFGTAPSWDNTFFEEAHQQAPPVSIRLNPLKETQSFDSLARVPWCTRGRYLESRPVFTLDPLFHAGAYYVQEASSMFVAQAFEQHVKKQQALKVLDLCAAPGGKSTLLASLLEQDDLLISNEVIQTRASILVENMTRWGQMNTWVTNNDPKDFGRVAGFFDAILVDAPCSGSGLWRKDPKAIDEWSTENVQLCKERQQRILADVLPALKKEGILIYATCSYSVEENEQIVDWLIRDMGMESLPMQCDPDWGITETLSPEQKGLGYRFYPWKTRGEGFFLAVFKKQEGIVTDSLYHSVSKQKNNQKAELELHQKMRPYLNTDFEIFTHKELIYAINPVHMPYLEPMRNAFYIKKAGTAMGQILKDLVPEHDLAMSVHLSDAVSRIELSHEEALHYLKKESVKTADGYKGWQVATHQGLALGWGKWMPNRMNNYLPKHYRIRMDIP
ncbi:RNA methyltransferase [Taibaiella sp. KBW10]|uniref:methyltransferase RsmF C-terminal domain-like protein n=1 Tax=Taibaiella sp. KBW10 TaxID=2153357 RepID=UPI000F59F76A|nr:RNA methyltransferase [Taibaiella sp. KBW10]RQO32076.1 RNA methyltransferase [Taibaiella sp. KBW10]